MRDRTAGYKAATLGPKYRCPFRGSTEINAASFNSKLTPLAAGANVSVPPFRSASSRAMARP
jgi:hypothetical protein